MDSESTSNDPVNGGMNNQRREYKKSNSHHRKFDWGRFLSTLVTAAAMLVVAFMGNKINKTISESRQRSDDFAVYVNRDAAQNSLRAEVFSVLAQNVVTQLESEDFKKVALLAAFHGNFSQFMDTRPVFEAFLTEVRGADARYELRRLALRVARRQADFIESRGGARDRKTVVWLSDPKEKDGNKAVEFSLHGHTMLVEINQVWVDGILVEDVENSVAIEVSLDGERRGFTVSYLDAPYIDNIFLVHPGQETHRVALLLLDISEVEGGYAVELEALHFPANIIMPTDVLAPRDIEKAIGKQDSDQPQEPHDEHPD